MRGAGVAEFPDSVSTRAAKHQGELANMIDDGARAVTVYLCQREDCDTFRLADDIDPDYVEAFKTAQKAGVEALAYVCDVTPTGITVARSVKITV